MNSYFTLYLIFGALIFGSVVLYFALFGSRQRAVIRICQSFASYVFGVYVVGGWNASDTLTDDGVILLIYLVVLLGLEFTSKRFLQKT